MVLCFRRKVRKHGYKGPCGPCVLILRRRERGKGENMCERISSGSASFGRPDGGSSWVSAERLFIVYSLIVLMRPGHVFGRVRVHVFLRASVRCSQSRCSQSRGGKHFMEKSVGQSGLRGASLGPIFTGTQPVRKNAQLSTCGLHGLVD